MKSPPALNALLLPLCLIALVALFHLLIHDPRVADDNRVLTQDRDRLARRNDQLMAEIAALHDEIERLKDPQGEESLRYARAEMGLIRPGEVVYRFEEDQ
ncbi:septum formation initiator family protein [Myxococcota bacterium]|nr:septum formation initiator family protein [Myxococcota bacterium]MBU1429444.1 septum formation initiator family protein [Myxococcota bacterium]MBU1898458.1 septum formation initiator family protein [Myxococcota bacterium]